VIIRRRNFPMAVSEGGFTTLVVALIILFLVTFVTFYAAKVGVTEQRISANQFRAEEALAAAEARIEQGIAYLKSNRRQISSWNWVTCESNYIAPPCNDETGDWEYIDINEIDDADDNTIQLPNDSNDESRTFFLNHTTDPMVFMVVAKGYSADESGQALAKQGLYFYPFRATIPDAPLMAAGEIGGSGTLDVVTNPNGGGLGVPLSAWANDDVKLQGSVRTCQVGEFLATNSDYSYQTDNAGNTITLCPKCDCPSSDFLSDSSIENIDILDVDNHYGVNADTIDFPPDVFEYIFGVPEKDWQTIKDEAVVLVGCNSLSTVSSGLYWITGNCAPGNNIGSYAAPVLLVVEGDVTINSNLQIFGLIFSFSSTATGTANVKLNGGPTLYGAVASNRNIDLGNGTYRMRFDGTVLQNLYNSIGGRGTGPIPGSWADYYVVDGT
jgi:hypothetical protein